MGRILWKSKERKIPGAFGVKRRETGVTSKKRISQRTVIQVKDAEDALYELRQAYDECLHPIESSAEMLMAGNHREAAVVPVHDGNVLEALLEKSGKEFEEKCRELMGKLADSGSRHDRDVEG